MERPRPSQVFSVADIQKQLLSEANRFLTVDAAWNTALTDLQTSPNVLRAASTAALAETFRKPRLCASVGSAPHR